MMTAFYNEIDPYAAQWLRNLIAAGQIAHGVVDERSIVDLDPDELRAYIQCHFFAGLGGWSRALRLAGWSDDRPVWTGSCPCQPFSAAGKGEGHEDERHLWPAWFRLIRECRPPAVFGEQVASADGLAWLDVVCADMEAEAYAIAAADLCAAGVGAPHIRQRLYFVADSGGARTRRDARATSSAETSSGGSWRSDGIDGGDALIAGGATGSVADSIAIGSPPEARLARVDDGAVEPERPGDAGLMGDAGDERLAQRVGQRIILGGASRADARQAIERAGVHSFWSDADWLPCRDGKARPVEPGTFPLACGATSRVGRLRAYGNAIVPQVAAAFVQAYLRA